MVAMVCPMNVLLVLVEMLKVDQLGSGRDQFDPPAVQSAGHGEFHSAV
jgi:hypothetical protein